MLICVLFDYEWYMMLGLKKIIVEFLFLNIFYCIDW